MGHLEWIDLPGIQRLWLQNKCQLAADALKIIIDLFMAGILICIPWQKNLKGLCNILTCISEASNIIEDVSILVLGLKPIKVVPNSNTAQCAGNSFAVFSLCSVHKNFAKATFMLNQQFSELDINANVSIKFKCDPLWNILQMMTLLSIMKLIIQRHLGNKRHAWQDSKIKLNDT